MRPIHLLFFLLFISVAKATNSSFSLIPQPANLVGDSVPGCIPLTYTTGYTNYNFGVHGLVDSPHPFIYGAKEWSRGSESNHNLASVFGIEVDPEGKFYGSPEPLIIHVKDWEIPAYCPHTREEVLAATIHCLVRITYASKERPLEIRITTGDAADQKWAKSYQKKYYRQSPSDQEQVTPTPIGESEFFTDEFGIQYILFPKKNPKRTLPKIKPVLLPVFLGSSGDNHYTSLIPNWTGTTKRQPLDCLSYPNSNVHNLFLGHKRTMELNPILAEREMLEMKVEEMEDATAVRLTTSAVNPTAITPTIIALTLANKIRRNKPVTVTIDSYLEDSKTIAELLKLPGWKETTIGRRTAATATLDFDLETKSITGAGLPGNPELRFTKEDSMQLATQIHWR